MKTDAILFSIVLPCYNRAQFIMATIRTVLQQEYANWELIIVNDGSTDETETITKSISDARIKYVAIANGERGAARNAGIKLANGDYVCFLDSDDQLLPHHLSTAVRFIESDPTVPVFHQAFEIRRENGKLLFASALKSGELNNALIRNNVISPNGIFLRKDVISSNLFKPDRALAGTEDYELWLRIASNYPIKNNPVFTSILVDHDQRSMNEHDLDKLLNRIYLFLHVVENDSATREWLGSKYIEFRSWRFSYIALHAALAKHRKISFKHLVKSVVIFPSIVFNKRFYSIVYHLIK